MNKCPEEQTKAISKRSNDPQNPWTKKGQSDRAPKNNTGEERIEVRGPHKQHPQPGKTPPRGGQQGTYYPRTKGWPTKGIYLTTPQRGWLNIDSGGIQPSPPKRPAPLAMSPKTARPPRYHIQGTAADCRNGGILSFTLGWGRNGGFIKPTVTHGTHWLKDREAATPRTAGDQGNRSPPSNKWLAPNAKKQKEKTQAGQKTHTHTHKQVPLITQIL